MMEPRRALSVDFSSPDETRERTWTDRLPPPQGDGAVDRLLVAFGMALWVSGIQAQCPTEIQVVEPISCSGADDAVLTVTTPDGVDPAEVYWLLESDTLFGAVQSGLGPGSYLAFVPGCGTLGINVNEPFPFFISTSIDVLPNCDDPCSGVVTATANFGAPPSCIRGPMIQASPVRQEWTFVRGRSWCLPSTPMGAPMMTWCSWTSLPWRSWPFRPTPVAMARRMVRHRLWPQEDWGAPLLFLDRFARQCGWPWG